MMSFIAANPTDIYIYIYSDQKSHCYKIYDQIITYITLKITLNWLCIPLLHAGLFISN